MASTEVKDALRAAATKVADYVANVSELKVETYTIEVGSGQPPVKAASTIIKLDGDSTTEVPAVKAASGKLEIDTPLYDLHMQNVSAAISYRAKMMGAMLRLLRGAGGGGR